jgi:hypothetical protein
MATSTAVAWVVVLPATQRADGVELAGFAVGVTTGLGSTNWAILPSTVTHMLPSGPAAIPPEAGAGSSVMTPCVVIRPTPLLGLQTGS